MRIKRYKIYIFFSLPLLALLAGCYSETYDIADVGLGGTAQMVLAFVTPTSNATRSAAEDPDGYEAGIEYENDIDISGGDYHIYFFSYSAGDTKGGTLIAEFTPDEVTSSSSSSSTTYTMKGTLPEELRDINDFRVVILANWGSYPSITAGTTTIDDLCEGNYTTFYADKKFTIDADNLIPFYGVQEYTGVTFTPGTQTLLSTPVSLLRAVAKVEVILTADSDVETFDDISIVNYNAQGYNAPSGVYKAEDYDTEMKNNPSSGNWSDEWIKALHLVNGKNDADNKTQAIPKINDTTSNTWRIYVPEYDNSSTDYAYISLTINGEPYEIYFAEYTDGGTDNSVVANRYNIKRNNLYRFYVTYKYNHLSVWVEKWDDVFENEFNFNMGDND